MSNVVPSDESIARRILAGEQELFEILLKRHQNMVYCIGMRFFRNDFDACDFTQEVFLRAYDHLSGFRSTGLFKYWLAKIAVNHAKNMLKKIKPEPDVSCMNINSGEKTRDELYSYDEIKTVLLDAIDSLPDQYKICLDLYFFSGIPYPEISSITGIPLNTIKSNVLRAKQLLRNSLKGTIAEEYHEM